MGRAWGPRTKEHVCCVHQWKNPKGSQLPVWQIRFWATTKWFHIKQAASKNVTRVKSTPSGKLGGCGRGREFYTLTLRCYWTPFNNFPFTLCVAINYSPTSMNCFQKTERPIFKGQKAKVGDKGLTFRSSQPPFNNFTFALCTAINCHPNQINFFQRTKGPFPKDRKACLWFRP